MSREQLLGEHSKPEPENRTHMDAASFERFALQIAARDFKKQGYHEHSMRIAAREPSGAGDGEILIRSEAE